MVRMINEKVCGWRFPGIWVVRVHIENKAGLYIVKSFLQHFVVLKVEVFKAFIESVALTIERDWQEILLWRDLMLIVTPDKLRV